jgi:hypothetical protein
MSPSVTDEDEGDHVEEPNRNKVQITAQHDPIYFRTPKYSVLMETETKLPGSSAERETPKESILGVHIATRY